MGLLKRAIKRGLKRVANKVSKHDLFEQPGERQSSRSAPNVEVVVNAGPDWSQKSISPLETVTVDPPPIARQAAERLKAASVKSPDTSTQEKGGDTKADAGEQTPHPDESSMQEVDQSTAAAQKENIEALSHAEALTEELMDEEEKVLDDGALSDDGSAEEHDSSNDVSASTENPASGAEESAEEDDASGGVESAEEEDASGEEESAEDVAASEEDASEEDISEESDSSEEVASEESDSSEEDASEKSESLEEDGVSKEDDVPEEENVSQKIDETNDEASAQTEQPLADIAASEADAEIEQDHSNDPPAVHPPEVLFSADVNQRIEAASGWLILNHWATWCSPCMEEMPQLRHLRDHLPNGVELIGLSWDLFQEGDPVEAIERIKRETEEHDIPFSTWLIADSAEDFFSDLDVSWQKIPQTWVIMPGGIRAMVIEGPVVDKDVTQILQLISH